MKCDFQYVEPVGDKHRHRCAVCRSEVTHAQSDPQKIKRKCRRRPPAFGPGKELKDMLTALGVTEGLGCGCGAMVRKMNRWGVEGCRQHRQEIVATLRKNADAKGWGVKLTAAGAALSSGLAFQVNWLDPIPSLVDVAISRAAAANQHRQPGPTCRLPAS